ncbi:hypothetical protein HDU97_008351 [Phlyctochytrium planicorne]|nr:hypothetical protein HDU97_008351 [Phlyctochytrium planicorne]
MPPKPPTQKATACDNCYTSKRKCDGAIPRCSVCKKSRAECTYVRRFVSPSLIRRPRKEHEEEINQKLAKQLEQKLSQVEKTVKGLFKGLANEQASQVSDGSASSDTRSLKSESNSPPQPTFPAFLQQQGDNAPIQSHRAGANSAFFSTEELLLDMAFPATSRFAISKDNPELNEAWVNELEDAFTTSLDVTADADMPQSAQSTPELAPLSFFMPIEERNNLIDVFFDITRRVSIYIFPLPVVHEGQFWRRLNSSNPPSQSLILAMCALAAASGPSADGSRWPYHSFCQPSDVARSDDILSAALSSLNIEQPSIDSCQALTIMVWHCAIVAPLRLSQEWLLSGMALRMVSLLKLDIDPDVLEAEDPTKRRWTWLEKETRRRLFALMVAIDQVDLVFREVSFGLWKRKTSVKPPSTLALWLSIDVETEEPTVDPRTLPPLDAGIICLKVADLCCRITEFNMARGISYSATIYTPAQTNGAANPLIPSNPKSTLVDPAVTAATTSPNVVQEDLASPEVKLKRLDDKLIAFQKILPVELTAETIDQSVVFRTRYDWPPSGPPLYQGIRVQLWYHACVIVLHRPRMIQAIAQVAAAIPMALAKAATALQNPANAGNPIFAGGIDWSFMRSVWEPSGGPDALRRCLQSAIGITKTLLKPIQIIPPSFLFTSSPIPVGSFCAVNESRSVLEAGLHHLVMIVLLSGLYGLGPPPQPDKPQPPPVSKAATVPRPISMLVQEVLGHGAIQEARQGLSVALGVLQDIAVRRPRVKVMSEMLQRLIDAAGITGLDVVPLGGLSGNSD